MRTLDKLLLRVDARGFERSAQQLEFHQAFKKAAARVIYRGSWETDRPMIMEKYGWERCNSEVLIRRVRAFATRTPTHTDDCFFDVQHPSSFWEDVLVRIALLNQVQYSASLCHVHCRIAIFCACLALALGLEIVVFSEQCILNTYAQQDTFNPTRCVAVQVPHDAPLVNFWNESSNLSDWPEANPRLASTTRCACTHTAGHGLLGGLMAELFALCRRRAVSTRTIGKIV